MRGKKRPTSERARAVGIALIDGPQAASDATGIPRTTILQWTRLPEYDELRQKTPDAVADMLWAAVQIGVDQVAIGLLGDEPLRDKAVALGILYDKHALMTGQVTSRIESTLLAGRSDHEQRILGDIINAELERRADADADGAQARDPVAQSAAREAGPTGG